jgi:signal transduction histidine kinase
VAGDRRGIPQTSTSRHIVVGQEALTNCLRHAGAAATEVLVRYADHELELEVADRGVRARMSGGRGAVAS